MQKKDENFYLIAVDMGYGHQRAAYPLRHLAYKNEIINANCYAGIPKGDRNVWEQSREAYEFISRFKKVPLVGQFAFDLFDKLQEIPAFYPKRDLSRPSLQLKSTYSLFKRKAWGKHLIDKLAKNPRPIVSTFFIPAFMAEYFKYPGEIYCLATDTDVSRAWAPLNPSRSKIKYLAPNNRVAERLKLYGVRASNIFVTGFPLPEENIGKKRSILKKDIGHRLFNLDPNRIYIDNYEKTVKEHLGAKNFPTHAHHPLTLMFAVGGAGAQRDLGIEIVKSLKRKIKENKIHIILIAGIHNDIYKFFRTKVRNLGLGAELGKNIKILASQSKEDYFRKFNRALRHTDILWTKPSELSFYTALGIPIIIADPIGSQEEFNKRWLRTLASATYQEDPKYTAQWLFDWLESGWFAEAAMNGFLLAPIDGRENIKKTTHHKNSMELPSIKEFPY
jgi:hypothetical protein